MDARKQSQVPQQDPGWDMGDSTTQSSLNKSVEVSPGVPPTPSPQMSSMPDKKAPPPPLGTDPSVPFGETRAKGGPAPHPSQSHHGSRGACVSHDAQGPAHSRKQSDHMVAEQEKTARSSGQGHVAKSGGGGGKSGDGAHAKEKRIQGQSVDGSFSEVPSLTKAPKSAVGANGSSDARWPGGQKTFESKGRGPMAMAYPVPGPCSGRGEKPGSPMRLPSSFRTRRLPQRGSRPTFSPYPQDRAAGSRAMDRLGFPSQAPGLDPRTRMLSHQPGLIPQGGVRSRPLGMMPGGTGDDQRQLTSGANLELGLTAPGGMSSHASASFGSEGFQEPTGIGAGGGNFLASTGGGGGGGGLTQSQQHAQNSIEMDKVSGELRTSELLMPGYEQRAEDAQRAFDNSPGWDKFDEKVQAEAEVKAAETELKRIEQEAMKPGAPNMDDKWEAAKKKVDDAKEKLKNTPGLSGKDAQEHNKLKKDAEEKNKKLAKKKAEEQELKDKKRKLNKKQRALEDKMSDKEKARAEKDKKRLKRDQDRQKEIDRRLEEKRQAREDRNKARPDYGPTQRAKSRRSRNKSKRRQAKAKKHLKTAQSKNPNLSDKARKKALDKAKKAAQQGVDAAKQALKEAEASGDADAIDEAKENLKEAEDTLEEVEETEEELEGEGEAGGSDPGGQDGNEEEECIERGLCECNIECPAPGICLCWFQPPASEGEGEEGEGGEEGEDEDAGESGGGEGEEGGKGGAKNPDGGREDGGTAGTKEKDGGKKEEPEGTSGGVKGKHSGGTTTPVGPSIDKSGAQTPSGTTTTALPPKQDKRKPKEVPCDNCGAALAALRSGRGMTREEIIACFWLAANATKDKEGKKLTRGLDPNTRDREKLKNTLIARCRAHTRPPTPSGVALQPRDDGDSDGPTVYATKKDCLERLRRLRLKFGWLHDPDLLNALVELRDQLRASDPKAESIVADITTDSVKEISGPESNVQRSRASRKLLRRLSRYCGGTTAGMSWDGRRYDYEARPTGAGRTEETLTVGDCDKAILAAVAVYNDPQRRIEILEPLYKQYPPRGFVDLNGMTVAQRSRHMLEHLKHVCIVLTQSAYRLARERDRGYGSSSTTGIGHDCLDFISSTGNWDQLLYYAQSRGLISEGDAAHSGPDLDGSPGETDEEKDDRRIATWRLRRHILYWCLGWKDIPKSRIAPTLAAHLAPEGKRRKYASELTEEIKKAYEWIRTVPKCPKKEDGIMQLQYRNGKPVFCRDTASNYHGKLSCYRSIAGHLGPGQQCCYFGGGLVTIHGYKGSPDRRTIAAGREDNGDCSNLRRYRGAAHYVEDRVDWPFSGFETPSGVAIPYELLRPVTHSPEMVIMERLNEEFTFKVRFR